MTAKKTIIAVQGTAITVLSEKEKDYICLTDIARVKNAERSDDLVRNWLRNRNTVEFLGIWERLNNPDFNSVEFDGFKMQAVTAAPTPTGTLPSNSPRGYRSNSSSTSLRNSNASRKTRTAVCRSPGI